jgi:hypothetical protein
MKDDLMKNPDLQSVQALWSDFLEVLADFTASFDHNGNPESENLKQRFKDLWIDCLCDRDEMDDFLSRKAEKPALSNFNHEILDEYAFYLYPESAPIGRQTVEDTQLDESPVPASCGELVQMYLHTFGNDDRGWTEIQRNFFPSLDVTTLRRSFGNLTSRETKDVDFRAPVRWSSNEDFIIVEEIEKHGITLKALHEVYKALGEGRSLDEIKSRVRVIYEGLAPREKKRKNRRVVKKSGPDWDLDDSLLQRNHG